MFGITGSVAKSPIPDRHREIASIQNAACDAVRRVSPQPPEDPLGYEEGEGNVVATPTGDVRCIQLLEPQSHYVSGPQGN